MPKRRMTAKRIIQIRNWQRASYSAPRVRAGVFPKTKAKRIAYYRNSGMSMPGKKKAAPVYASSQTAGRVRYGNINTYYYPGSSRY